MATDITPLIELLRDPEFVAEVGALNQYQAVRRVIVACNRELAPGISAFRTYRGLRGSASGMSIRVDGAKVMEAETCGHKLGFVSRSIVRDNLAEALLCGYFLDALTDDPIPDNI